jgi:hypothetical protein
MHYTSEFPRLVSYNRFVELMQRAVMPQMVVLRSVSESKSSKYINKSTKLEVFKDIAKCGKASTGRFFVFKLHIIMNDHGEMISISITPGDRDDLADVHNLARHLKGRLFGDREYIGKSLADKLKAQGLELVTKLKKT